MADINALPKEILDHVISFMDDKTKRVSRLASTQWFKQIQYTNFQLGDVRDDQLEAVTTRLAQYDIPISIKFAARIQRKLAQVVDPLTKLTNLVSLTMGAFGHPTISDWLKITHLTNLKYLYGVSPKELNMTLCSRMTWLRNFVEYDRTSLDDARQIVQCLTNLEELDFTVDDVPDAFELVSSLSHLTSLNQFHSGCKTISEENTKSLAKLKFLTCDVDYKGDEEMSLRYMTALEELATCVPFHNVTSTRLTFVRVNERAIASMVQHHSKFPTLKELSVRFTESDIKLFDVTLASFSNLESLVLEDWHESYDAIYNLVSSTNLTSLDLNNWHLTAPIKLTSIEALRLDVTNEGYSALSHLINLTRLEILSQHAGGQRSLPTTLTNIKYLAWNVNGEMHGFRLLTNLEHLRLDTFKADQLNGLEIATRLTYLYLCSSTNEVVDCGFLKNMTLMEHLDLSHKVICQNIWQHMSRLKNLRFLTLPRLEREQDVLSLTNMTNLRKLTTTAQYVKGVYLTLLTSLQSLHFLSDVAAQAISVDKLYSSLTRLSDHRFN